MEIKDTVQVGGMMYRIVVTEYFKSDDDDRNLWGYCDYANATIYIRESLDTKRKQQVFMHEFTHAVFYESGFSEMDEEVVQRLSLTLYQTLAGKAITFSF